MSVCGSVCVSLSLVVEESDATVVTASDEGWGSGRVGETTDGGQVTCTQRNKRSSEHVQETNLPTFWLVAWGKITIRSKFTLVLWTHCTLPYTHIPPTTHTCHQRCTWLCCSCVPAEYHLLLLSGLTHQHWRKKVNHSSPSLSRLWANYTHPIDMYTSTEQYIPSAPTHHSPQCVWTLRMVCTEV